MEELLSHWDISSNLISPISEGLINGSFKVKKDQSSSYILQRINQTVFPQPNDLMNNHQIISEHLATQSFPFKGPKWIKTNEGNLLQQFDGGYWRLGAFFEETQTFVIAADADMAWKVGQAFGLFDKSLLDLSTDRLKDTIVEFHNLERYVNKLTTTIKIASPSRLKTANKLIESVDDYLFLANLPFPKNRVIHNDAKVSNLLFRNQEVYAVIDWDTTMAGHISWEFADLFRTTVVNVPEDHPEVSDMVLEYDMMKGLSVGYKSVLFDFLSDSEKNSLYHGALYLIFEQAVRFLEDYLAGDDYYQCDYDDHNYIRARNQFNLLSLMVQDKKTIINTIQRS